MNLSSLITDCQVKLFNRLHLTDQLRLRATCRTLNASFLTNAAATRKSLVLKLGPYESATGADDLVCPYLDRHICDFLLFTFPTITKLQIETSKEIKEIFAQLSYLLDGWSDQLQSLSINLNFNPTPTRLWNLLLDPDITECLLRSINRLPFLASLTLKCHPRMPTGWKNLSILGRLEAFTLDADCPLHQLYDSLVTYALPNDQLRTISLKKVHCANAYTEEAFFCLDEAFTRKFTSIGHLSMSSRELFLYASKFTSLQSYHVFLNNKNGWLAFDRISALLTEHMKHLETLKLSVNFELCPDDDALHCIPMPSVKHLDLEIRIMTNHTNISKYLQPRVRFPNLQSASTEILDWNCLDCGIKEFFATLPEAKRVCREHLERPLLECPKFSGTVVQER